MTGEIQAADDPLRGANVVGAVYGTIIATAFVAGLSEETGLGPWQEIGTLLGSSLVVWLAHVYADVMQRRVHVAHRLRRDEIRRAAGHQWPLLQSALPLAAMLVLAGVGVVPLSTGEDLALAVGILALVGWGWTIARRAGLGLRWAAASAATDAVFGGLIIVLKVVIH